MENMDELYDWIKRVINMCDHPGQVAACDELIGIFEKKGPPEYLIKALRTLLKFKEESVSIDKKRDSRTNIGIRIFELYNSGHTPKEIAEMLDIRYNYCIDILNKKRRTNRIKK